jgi:hypothetical protein
MNEAAEALAHDVQSAIASTQSAPFPIPTIRSNFQGPRAPLFKALAEARKHFLSLTADSEVKVELKGGGGYNHSYADLDKVIKSLTPGWVAADLAVIQLVDGEDLTTVVGVGESSLTIACPIPRYDTPQQMGSAITYIRRYQLKAVFCVNDSEDDDGNAASGNKAQVTRKEPTVAPKAAPQSEERAAVVAKAKELGLDAKEFGSMVKEHTKKAWGECNDVDARVLLTVLEAKAVFGKDGAK